MVAQVLLTMAVALPPPPQVVAPARPSVPVGTWADGRLRHGVQLRPESTVHFTWDAVRLRSPNRGTRRWGTDTTVRALLRVLEEYTLEHPEMPRIGVQDLSRPRGGPFGPAFGGLGHASHQNGLDVDITWPRRDGRETGVRHPREVDRRAAQALVDAFLASRPRPIKLFVGPRLGLRGPRSIVQPLVHHDDHLHVRYAPPPPFELGPVASIGPVEPGPPPG